MKRIKSPTSNVRIERPHFLLAGANSSRPWAEESSSFFSTEDLTAQERRLSGSQDLPADFNAFLRIGANDRSPVSQARSKWGKAL